MSIQLLIKGDVERARERASDLGMDLTNVRPFSFGAVSADTSLENESKVVRWYISDLDHDVRNGAEGYAEGSLLHYRLWKE